MNSKLLKSYKGFTIEKSWDETSNGTIKKDTVTYTAYTVGEDIFDADSVLANLKQKIDEYIR